MLDYFCSVPLPTPLRANPARNGDPGCAGLGCRQSSFSRLPRISFGGGTAGPSTPPEAGSARDDNSRESAGSARDDNSRESAGCPRDDNSGGNNENRGPSTPLRSAQDDTQVFWLFVQAGRRLAELQVNYEQQIEYPLERVEKGQLNWRVEKMRLSKDKTTLVYNDFLTLKGVPLETYRVPIGQSFRAGVGHRSVPGFHRQAQRHRQRSQPRPRSRIHRAPHRAGHHRQPGDDESRQELACSGGLGVDVRLRTAMLGYFCSVPLPTPLRANPARNGEPGCAGLGCRRSSFSRLPRISFVGGTAGPSTPPEAGCARDDSSRENAGSARNDNSKRECGTRRRSAALPCRQ
jgi:hypothetical protein